MEYQRNSFASQLIGAGMGLFVFIAASLSHPIYANDTAAEIAVGGIQLKEEKNISIEKEELIISRKRVEVNYLFRNHSDVDITTEIAFPVPQYEFSLIRGIPDFNDFTLEINGQKATYKKEVRAFAEGKDCTRLLEGMNVSISDFEKFDSLNKPHYISKLNETDKATLIKLRIVDTEPELGWPLWSVSIKYHWTQTFPANKTISIRHTYTPEYGYAPVEYDLNKSETSSLLKESCIDKETQGWIKVNSLRREENYFYPYWVSYILMTANNWRKPIKSFRLIIEDSENERSSFCFDHNMIRTSPTRLEVHVKDFIPRENLKVFFFEKVDKTR